MTRRARKLDPVTEAMSSEAYRIQAMVDGLDQVAIAMERKWGVGRLRLLVSDFLRAKFDEQKDRLDAAIQSGEERYVAAQVDGMRRAWSALDRAAHDAGHQPLAPEVWECVLPSTGEVVSLVRTAVEAHQPWLIWPLGGQDPRFDNNGPKHGEKPRKCLIMSRSASRQDGPAA